MGEQEGEVKEYIESAKGRTTVPGESWADVSVHGFWKWGTYAIFNMQIINLDAGSYLRQTSAKSLAMA